MIVKWYEKVNDFIPPGTLRFLSLVYTNVVLATIAFAKPLGVELSPTAQIIVFVIGAFLSTAALWRAKSNEEK